MTTTGDQRMTLRDCFLLDAEFPFGELGIRYRVCALPEQRVLPVINEYWGRRSSPGISAFNQPF
jgi:hypothetical protein